MLLIVLGLVLLSALTAAEAQELKAIGEIRSPGARRPKPPGRSRRHSAVSLTRIRSAPVAVWPAP